MIKTFLIYCISFWIFMLTTLNAQTQYNVFGKVIDSESGRTVPGASIYVMNTNKGTYSSSKGTFRLPFLEGNQTLKITSLGYESTTLKISSATKDSLIIKLKPTSVLLSGVKVVADIEPNEIIRRAIQRKVENQAQVKTFSGLLYSKMVIELGGSIVGSTSSSGNSFSFKGSLGPKVEQENTMFLMETFSKVFNDKEKNISHTEIIQRRQTANIKPQDNIMAIGNFINFYNDEINFINVHLVTPLSKDALSYYKFTLREKTVLDDRYVYVLDFEPSSDLYPLFIGTIKIIENTYNLVELDLKPSNSTAISFIDELHFNQKYSEVQKNIWQPTYLEVKGKVRVDVIKSLLDIKVDLTATSIYTDVTVNEPLPDSLYAPKLVSRVSIAPTADSTKKEFWENNSLRELSEREQKIYTKVDSLVVLRDSTAAKDSAAAKGFSGFDYFPSFDFNRVGAISLGISPILKIWGADLKANGEYSFGLKQLFGYVKCDIPIINSHNFDLSINGSVFSQIETIGTAKPYPPIVNTLAAGIFHTDYYDYYRKDGFGFGIQANIFDFDIKGNIELTQQFSVKKNTNNSIFSSNEWRENPAIREASYRVGSVGLSLKPFDYFGLSSNFEGSISLSGRYGENTNISSSFRSVEGTISLTVPTFSTGYKPMTLSIVASAGKASEQTPLQYQFLMPTRLVFINKSGHFFTAPVSYYGGTEYYIGHAAFNLTDIWWRAIGLPLYEGRGLDLILAGSTGRYLSNATNNYYVQTPEYYSEVGFGLSRIPTFISNLIYLSFDARWGIGSIAKDRFGCSVSVTLPF